MSRLIIGLVVGLLIGVSVMYFVIKPSEKPAEKTALENVKPEEATPKSKGELVYEKSCKICHPMRPPAGQAPPMLGLSNHYHEMFLEKEKAVAHMVDFMQAPDSAKSVIEPMGLKRFGLMPAMPNSKEELTVVAGWLWDQYDPSFQSRGCN